MMQAIRLRARVAQSVVVPEYTNHTWRCDFPSFCLLSPCYLSALLAEISLINLPHLTCRLHIFCGRDRVAWLADSPTWQSAQANRRQRYSPLIHLYISDNSASGHCTNTPPATPVTDVCIRICFCICLYFCHCLFQPTFTQTLPQPLHIILEESK